MLITKGYSIWSLLSESLVNFSFLIYFTHAKQVVYHWSWTQSFRLAYGMMDFSMVFSHLHALPVCSLLPRPFPAPLHPLGTLPLFKRFILCMWVFYECTPVCQKRATDPIVDDCEPCGCWGMNSGLLEEQIDSSLNHWPISPAHQLWGFLKF